jgi:alpha-glucosidase
MNERPWWRNAVIYEVYIRSFADSDGDGIGDAAGIYSRVPYLAELGVDAIWVTPWYPSPMVDGGYDVADYCGIDPRLGTLSIADALVTEAHRHGIRVILDAVPNHTSSEHPWFRDALRTGPGPPRDRYIFRDGRGPGGAEPPCDWLSVFGGPAWTRITESSGRPGQWYLHLFDAGQPDLNWAGPRVPADFEAIFRFWLDRSVDGFRIDTAQGLVKDQDFPDLGSAADLARIPPGGRGHPYWDRDGVHDIYRSWRALFESYGPDRLLVAEAIVASPERLARYVRPDELHTAFNFDLLACPWDAGELRGVIDANIAAMAAVGAPASWVLSSHDVVRHVTRYGRARTGARAHDQADRQPADTRLGSRRARAAALLLLALPGIACLYQGEELGLPEVADIPERLLQDPAWKRSGHTVRGRDGCRVPIPWSGDAPPFGFGPPGSVPWLPQPAEWRGLSVQAQRGDPDSMLTLYRTALRARHEHPDLRDTHFRWLPSPDGVLLFERGQRVRCAVNLSQRPFRLPEDRNVLAASETLREHLPPDAAAWWV